MVAVRRAALRVAYRVLRVYWWALRPRTTGVKCVLEHDGEILLVRHTYGDRSMWHMPGGGVRRGESPADAVRRELREELGTEVGPPRPVATVEDRGEFKRDTMHCFAATAERRDVRANPAEIAEARWVAPDALPAPLERFAPHVLAAWKRR